MRLADDYIAISLLSETIQLRPTLRAAFLLCNAYGDFHNLVERIAECNLTACTDLIKHGGGGSEATNAFAAFVGRENIIGVMDIRNELLEFVLILSGAKDREPEGKASTAKPIPFEEYHTRLFRIATGWLGWTPDQAWNATPAEILEAHKGRLEMLAAIFGSKKADDSISREEVTPELRARLNALGDTSILTMSQVPPCP